MSVQHQLRQQAKFLLIHQHWQLQREQYTLLVQHQHRQHAKHTLLHLHWQLQQEQYPL